MIRTGEYQGALWITLDREDKANALTREMLVDIRDAVLQASTKVIVLTGKGRVFCAGADLEAARAGLATDGIWEEVSGAIAASHALTIAALNGTVAGGAFGMVLACDLRIAVPSAKFFYPVMKLGFLPQPSDPPRLTRLIGPAATKRILMAGEKLSADEAHRIGLVDHLSDQLPELVATLGADALAADAGHVAAIKAMIPT